MLEKVKKRLARKNRVKAGICNSAKPKLTIYRSNSFIYAQITNLDGKVVCSASDLKTKGKTNKTESSKKVGEDIAKKALENKITEVVFDRNGFAYHGRIEALATSARENGLKF